MINFQKWDQSDCVSSFHLEASLFHSKQAKAKDYYLLVNMQSDCMYIDNRSDCFHNERNF